MIIKKVAGGAAEWEALRQMSPTFLSPFQQVSFFFFVVLNVFRFFYLNKSFFRIFWIYFNRYLLASISSTSSGISVPLSSASPRRPYVDHCPNQATGLLTVWIGCLSSLLNSPLRLPALDLRPVQPTKVGAHILASREKNVNFGHFFWGKNKSFPPWGFIFFVQPEMVDSE